MDPETILKQVQHRVPQSIGKRRMTGGILLTAETQKEKNHKGHKVGTSAFAGRLRRDKKGTESGNKTEITTSLRSS